MATNATWLVAYIKGNPVRYGIYTQVKQAILQLRSNKRMVSDLKRSGKMSLFIKPKINWPWLTLISEESIALWI